jgi:hypothetical protein
MSDDLVKHLRNSKGWPTLGNAAADRIEELEAKNKRLREALTPSGDTKAAYAGEFHISVYDADDEDGNEIWRKVPVDWTTIKAIMAAIRNRAALQETDQ